MCLMSHRLARPDIRATVSGVLRQGPASARRLNHMCSKFAAIKVMIAAALAVSSSSLEAMPVYGIEQAVALAQERNPEILIAHKKVMGARGGFIEARSGYLPSLSSSGLYDKRQTESQTNLRQEDYNAIVKLEQNLYTGGAVSSQVAIAQLNIAKAN